MSFPVVIPSCSRGPPGCGKRVQAGPCYARTDRERGGRITAQFRWGTHPWSGRSGASTKDSARRARSERRFGGPASASDPARNQLSAGSFRGTFPERRGRACWPAGERRSTPLAEPNPVLWRKRIDRESHPSDSGRLGVSGDCRPGSSRHLLGLRPPGNRGRDAGYPAPPAQIRACATNALGSCLGSWRQSAPRDKGDRSKRAAATAPRFVPFGPTSGSPFGYVA